MAVRIRMKKMGRRHRPFFRICVMDSRKPRDGKAIEEVGYYDPMVKDKKERVQLKLDRIDYWMSVGAQPSDKVATLIKKVKTDSFTEGAAPPPMTAPKQPEPEVTETPESEASDSADAATEDTLAAEAPAEEATAEEAAAEETSE